ncbi:MAG: otsB, partial [Marmoricola sp.]|nr:otsB [Marmoricola sp.]
MGILGSVPVPAQRPVAPSSLLDALAPLLADPARSAVLLDVDGTLAPIVRHAEDAQVPEPTRAPLIEIAKRYGVVACVSG